MILDDHINLLNLFVVAILVCLLLKFLYTLSSYIDFYVDSSIYILVTLYLQKTVYTLHISLFRLLPAWSHLKLDKIHKIHYQPYFSFIPAILTTPFKVFRCSFRSELGVTKSKVLFLHDGAYLSLVKWFWWNLRDDPGFLWQVNLYSTK